MANQEDSEIDIEIRSLVSQLRELHEKLEEQILKLMKVVEERSRTNDERETPRVSIEMLIKGREEVRKLLEDHAVFVNARNKNNSLDMKTSRMSFLKERGQNFKNLDQGIQERQNGDHFSDQEKGEDSNSSGYVADVEIEPKDPIFSLDDSDTSSEEAIEVWDEKNVDPDMKRRFLEKATGSSYEMETGLEIEIEEYIDTFDDKGFSTNIKELREQRDLFIAETSAEASSADVKKDGGNHGDMEYPPDDGHVLSNIEGLVEDLKYKMKHGSGSLQNRRKKKFQ